MKKIFICLVSLMMILSLAACSSEISSTESGSAPEEKITFSEITAVDNDQCLIKITEIDPEGIFGYTLKTSLENKSADKTYMFSLEKAAVNGVECDPYFAAEVAAGKKSNEEISFDITELEENGITNLSDIELTFRVYDYDNWESEDVANEIIHVYPYGEEKAVKYQREAKTTDNVVIDNDNVTVIVTGYETDEIFGYTANLYLVNKTDKNLMFSANEVSVNGFMVDPYFATSVGGGKSKFASMSWSEDSFAENGIDKAEEIEFVLRAYDEDNWSSGDYVNQTITLNP